MRFNIPMPDREHDPALVELVYGVQYTSNFWCRSYDAHAEGSVLIREPVIIESEVLRPVHFLERGETFWRGADEQRGMRSPLCYLYERALCMPSQ